jgi:hypothetical protein
MGSEDNPAEPHSAPSPVPPRVGTYLYPWDLIGDPDAVPRLVGAGFDQVTVAAAYHSVRAATPQHPQHRFVVAETAALYRPVRNSAWGARRLTPLQAPWTGSDDSFLRAVEALAENGVGVTAWVVLTHNSFLGRRHPDLVVTNCFRDSYEYALCPANEEVRDYAALLAVEAVRELPLAGVSLEACGQLGASHRGHHEKSSGAYTSLAEKILSICCCAACRRGWSIRGLDTGAVVRALREAFESATGEAGDDASPAEVLGPQLAAQLLASRHTHTDALLGEVLGALAEVDPSLRITLHAQSDPWATGASPGLTPGSARHVNAVLVPVEAKSPDCAEVIATARGSVPASVGVAAYANLLEPVEPDDLDAIAGRLLHAGADELQLYHFGIANKSQLALFAALASASR